MSTYPKPAGGAPDFPALESDVLDYWDSDDTFRASISHRDGAPEYVFYDGPPFANGLPHYGHLLTGYVKDIVPRYRTMRGYKVDRRFGWDTHGLPAELEVQRQLGITEKAQIEEMGIEKFNDACRASVLRYTNEWQAYVTRQARWVDFENDYKTLDLSFMESTIWAFKQLWDKGLAYEGYRVLPYCWNDETPLSSHELRMDDDVYQSRQDPAITVGFPVTEGPLKDAYLLVWTTTPWTLPSNQAVAVNRDVDYALVRSGDRRYVLATARLSAYARELGDEPEVLATYRGSDLLGMRYRPPFPYFMDAPNSFQVLPGDFVSTEDGTGIVHMAPAYGEDDMATAQAADIVAVTPVDAQGRFDATVPDYAGRHVFEANPQIIRDLKNQAGPAAANGSVLVRHETYEHSYPHCWRCRNPLIYRAVSSWFVKVTEFRDRMVELNQEITWYPEHVKDGQFGKWLQGARDWSISRNRYWGTPIPVWSSDDPTHPRVDVYGSLDDLERDFGVRPDNLHRPYIDELTRPNPDDPTGKSTMRRIPDVFDVWFDSGSMPYAQVHYPFENAEWFDGVAAARDERVDAHFPGDFIVEYIGQTRGWFYTLHVLATALFDKPAFRTCVAHGIVLGNDGQKMSKSLRNYPDVTEVFDRNGSDAMRWFLMASPILRGGNLIVTEQGIREGVRQVLLPFWNAYTFLALYAPKKGTWRTDSRHVLDRYILAKLAALRDDLTASMDACDISGACDELRQFTEALTNWYVRRSRSRFWDEDPDAIDTLHTVLEVTSRLAAPLLPLVTEVVWRGLTGGRSVHLTDWPESGDLPPDADLVATMDQVREVASAASSLRKAKKLRVRLPLPELTVAVDDPQRLEPFRDLLADELNVKHVTLTDDIAAYGRFELTVNARVAGPRIGKDVQAAIKAVKAGEGVVNADGTLTAGPAVLLPEEFSSRLVAADPEFTAALPGGSGLVVLDGTVTPELEAEGWAKDRIRELQELRRTTGLDVSDRISVVMAVPAGREDWARTHADMIAREILATTFEFGQPGEASDIGDGVRVAIAKA